MRVSKYGVIVNEPNDSWLTRLATKFGFAQKIERSGNYVYRYSKRDVQKIADSLFYKYEIESYFTLHKVAKNKTQFILLKAITALLNFVCPSLGNQITFVILKNN